MFSSLRLLQLQNPKPTTMVGRWTTTFSQTLLAMALGRRRVRLRFSCCLVLFCAFIAFLSSITNLQHFLSSSKFYAGGVQGQQEPGLISFQAVGNHTKNSRDSISSSFFPTDHNRTTPDSSSQLDLQQYSTISSISLTQEYGCDDDFSIPTKVLLDHIHVHPLSVDTPSPTILCFIMTYTERHNTSVTDVINTWGKRCDKLILASDTTDLILGTIAMQAEATYHNLWNKLNETLHHVYYNYRNDYDWFLKVDDDSYVILENLKAFLMSKAAVPNHNHNNNNNNKPLIYGRQFGMPLSKLPRKISDKDFAHRLVQRYNTNHTTTTTLVFNSGGAGYVMNRPYFLQLIQALDTVVQRTTNHHDNTVTTATSKTTAVAVGATAATAATVAAAAPLQGKKCPEDLGQAITSLYYSGIVPGNSRDDQGRERFHFMNPSVAYHLPYRESSWVYGVHKAVGGISKGLDCCAPDTISFHYLNSEPGYMHYVDQQLYACRRHRSRSTPL
jgi:glycoprotein-N-acetylgalactosamine 3-beta-galactosyltransferase